jgi:phosphatidate cytidylyltransferase
VNNLVSGPDDPGGRAPLRWSNLALRVASAAVLAPVAVLTAYIGDWPFALFWGLAAIAVLWEWITLVEGPGHKVMFSSCAAAIAIATTVAWRNRPVVAVFLVGLGALAAAIFAAQGRRAWVTGGIVYAGAMVLSPMVLRADQDYGFLAMVLLFAIVWTTDVLGYFAGRAFGGPKLWPAISPKKTWSGAIAGALGSMIVGTVLAQFAVGVNALALAFVSLVLSALSQLGDLFESWIKRRHGAKDASHLIPGHGGVMDRLDGFWAAALAGCLIGVLRGGFEGAARGLLVW